MGRQTTGRTGPRRDRISAVLSGTRALRLVGAAGLPPQRTNGYSFANERTLMIRSTVLTTCLTVLLSSTIAKAQELNIEFNIGQAYGNGDAVYEMQYGGTWYNFSTVSSRVFTNYIISELSSTPWYMGADFMDGRTSSQGEKTALAQAVVEALGPGFGGGGLVYAYVAWDLNGDSGRDGFTQKNFFGQPVAEDYDDKLWLYYADGNGDSQLYLPPANIGALTYITATAIDGPTPIDAPTPVPEINGGTIPLLAFVLGVVGLGLRSRSMSTGSAPTA